MRSGRLELPHPKIRVPKTRAGVGVQVSPTALKEILIDSFLLISTLIILIKYLI